MNNNEDVLIAAFVQHEIEGKQLTYGKLISMVIALRKLSQNELFNRLTEEMQTLNGQAIKRMGVSRAALNRILNDAQDPNVYMFILINRVLAIPFELAEQVVLNSHKKGVTAV